MDAELRALFAEEAGELIEQLRADAARLEQPNRGEPLARVQRCLHTLKGAALAVGADAITTRVHALEDAVPQPSEPADAFVDQLLEALLTIEAHVRGTPSAPPEPVTAKPTPPPRARPAVGSAPPVKVAPPAPQADQLRISAERLDALHTAVGGLVVGRGSDDVLAAGLERLAALADRLAHADTRDAAALRREVFQLRQRHAEARRRADAGIDALDDALRRLRMAPLGPVLERLRTTVHQAARQTGRKVAFEVIGAPEVEVDRLSFGALRMALGHLLTNAVAHGIEPPSTRTDRGKPPAGRITIEVVPLGRSVQLVVRDDGRGIDREALRARAVSAGQWAPDAPIDDGDILSLMSAPGVSTAQALTEVSGRGVGMAAVEDGLRAVRGRISLLETSPAGTALQIELPIAHSRRQGLIVQVADHRVAVPLDAVDRVQRVRTSDRIAFNGAEGVSVDGIPVGLTSLAALLDLPESPSAEEALVLRAGGRRVALLVDSLEDATPLVVRPLGPAFERCPLYLGAAVDAHGALLGLLDPATVVTRAAEQPMVPRAVAASDQVGGTVLVVDDSLTTRSLLRGVLQVAGYEVLVAENGLQALECLDAHPECELVVSDVEMPQMDGLTLCQRIRAGRRPDLPLILVTSLAAPDEVRRGMEAGADAYVVKGRFDQGELLATVRRLVG